MPLALVNVAAIVAPSNGIRVLSWPFAVATPPLVTPPTHFDRWRQAITSALTIALLTAGLANPRRTRAQKSLPVGRRFQERRRSGQLRHEKLLSWSLHNHIGRGSVLSRKESSETMAIGRGEGCPHPLHLIYRGAHRKHGRRTRPRCRASRDRHDRHDRHDRVRWQGVTLRI